LRGDVDDGRQHQRALPRLDRIKADLDGKFRAVLAPSLEIAPLAHRPHRRRRVEKPAMLGVNGAEPLRQQHVDTFADQLGAVIAELPFQFGVRQHDRAGRIDHQNAARTRLHRELELAFGIFLIGDVMDDVGGAYDLAGRRPDRRDAE